MKTISEFNHIPKQAIIWGCLVIFGIWAAFPNDLLSLPPLVFLWPLGLAVIGRQAGTPWEALRRGWGANWGGAICALYWLAMPVAQVGELPWPLAFVCAALIAFCIGSQGGAFSLFAWSIKSFGIFTTALSLALAWQLLEIIYAFFPAFPWLPLSGALAQWPVLVQAADIFGANLTSAIWLFAALLCALPFFMQGDARVAIPLAGLIGACLLVYGIWQIGYAKKQPGRDHSIYAIMVEGNIDQNQKWTQPFQQQSLDIYINLTDMALEQAKKEEIRPDLLIWPETSLPFFFQRSPALAAQTRAAASGWHAPLLFGAPGVEEKNGKDAVFNRAFLLAGNGEIVGEYDKRQLVPFGEYAPEWLKLDFLEALLQGIGVYEPGASSLPLRYGQLALGVLICYEGIFPSLAQASVASGANILVDISNDGWFGFTPAARQHLYMTALRAIEQGRWLLRATNTGISAAIDPAGRVIQTGAQFKEEYIICKAGLISGQTFFHRIYPWLAWFCLFVFCSSTAAGFFLSGKARK